MNKDKAIRKIVEWRKDWNKFCYEALHARLDKEQQAIIESVQFNPRTTVRSGTARGKDFVSACACLSFLYLTPRWDKEGHLVKNTKVAMTAPTDRQIGNIMMPELIRLFRNAQFLPGYVTTRNIRTDYTEWFLTGFKAGDDNPEAWSGIHAVNTMFAVTEASGISETVYNSLEGNLQGNSRLLLVFNPNSTTGYAARSFSSDRFAKFTLNSLNAENVVKKKVVIPGQVDYDWVADKVQNWCHPIEERDFNEGEGDFRWEGGVYRPNDLFRVKVLGMFPKVSEDVLIPYEWVEIANRRWKQLKDEHFLPKKHCRLGVDVAGMGRDSSVLCARYGNFVDKFDAYQSAGHADHMMVAGKVVQYVKDKKAKAFIDTIGEGAGVFSRLEEQEYYNCYSAKFSEGTRGLHDVTGQYEFGNMRAYCYWAMRDWLNPKNGFDAALPPNDLLMEECTNTHWFFRSDGKIMIEPKEKIKEILKRSPDNTDALALTFYPRDYDYSNDKEIEQDFL